MRGAYRVFVVALIAAMASASWAQGNERAVRKALEPMYRKMEQAFLKRDVNAVMALTAPGFTGKSGDETVPADKVKMQIGMQFAMLKEMKSVKMQIAKLAIKGKDAIVVNRYAFSGVIEPQKGKTVKMADQGVTRDTWQKTAQGWRLLQIETVKSNPTIDGKPLKEAMAGKSGETRKP
ncbi:MAG: nuclear transport factor 2 family protein [Chthonomonadales bacterium]|nr:nuclear transport factor 2 family protein [Chthonomonadales bacterium]